MSDATHVAIIKTGHARRVIAIDDGVRRNAVELAAMGELEGVVTKVGRGAEVVSRHYPDGETLATRAARSCLSWQLWTAASP